MHVNVNRDKPSPFCIFFRFQVGNFVIGNMLHLVEQPLFFLTCFIIIVVFCSRHSVLLLIYSLVQYGSCDTRHSFSLVLYHLLTCVCFCTNGLKSSICCSTKFYRAQGSWGLFCKVQNSCSTLTAAKWQSLQLQNYIRV